MANRPDVALAKLNDETAAISARGTANGVLPVLEGVASLSSSGLAGTSSPQFGVTPDSRYIGNLGTALGQIFRNNFKNQRAAVLFQATLRNHVAQGDYGIDQLQLRQGDLIERKNLNQVVLDISNQMTALRQARSRYAQAVDTRKLQEELFEKEQQLFSFGSASIDDVVAAQTGAGCRARDRSPDAVSLQPRAHLPGSSAGTNLGDQSCFGERCAEGALTTERRPNRAASGWRARWRAELDCGFPRVSRKARCSASQASGGRWPRSRSSKASRPMAPSRLRSSETGISSFS